MTKPLFSICVIARNEGRSMPSFLAGLHDFLESGGDLTVVDTGSDDDTCQLAYNAGATVVQVGDMFKFLVTEEEAAAINAEFIEPPDHPIIAPGLSLFNFGAARNLSDSLARNDMIFTIDPDEVVLKMDIEPINWHIIHGAKRMDIWWVDARVKIPYYFDARWHDRRTIHWDGAMHEELAGEMDVPVARLVPDVLFVEHRPLVDAANTNRSKYLAGMAYSLYYDPSRLRQTHWLARDLLFNGRPKSAAKLFIRHILMPDKGGLR
jgi:glycosyltransferase involved in cell wall biosynthesis